LSGHESCAVRAIKPRKPASRQNRGAVSISERPATTGIGRYRVTGKVTSCSEPRQPDLRRSLSGTTLCDAGEGPAKIPRRHQCLDQDARKCRRTSKSLTWDRVRKNGRSQRFTLERDIKVYFCDLKVRWQRGTNENNQRALRQYFPKGKMTSLATRSQTQCSGPGS